LDNGILEHRRVLLVEDEPLIALDVEELCLEHGAAQVVTARRIEEAEAQDFSQFDVAIVDLVLGDRSTLPIAAAMRATGLPLVFTSGYSSAPELASAFGDVTLLSMPFVGNALVQALVAAIAAASKNT
jgi:CheY-like chemotaxis protein